MNYDIDGVEVRVIGLEMSLDETRKYVDYVKEHCEEIDEVRNSLLVDADASLESVEVILCADEKIDVNFVYGGKKFERIRRITGYLTGDVSSWNDAKRSEESERVKHGLAGFESSAD